MRSDSANSWAPKPGARSTRRPSSSPPAATSLWRVWASTRAATWRKRSPRPCSQALQASAASGPASAPTKAASSARSWAQASDSCPRLPSPGPRSLIAAKAVTDAAVRGSTSGKPAQASRKRRMASRFVSRKPETFFSPVSSPLSNTLASPVPIRPGSASRAPSNTARRVPREIWKMRPAARRLDRSSGRGFSVQSIRKTRAWSSPSASSGIAARSSISLRVGMTFHSRPAALTVPVSPLP